MEKISYALGVNIAGSFKREGIEGVDYAAFAKGFRDLMDGDSLDVTLEEANQLLQEFFTQMEAKKQNENIEAGLAFLAENAKKPGVVTLGSGLQYEVLTEGAGAKPAASDKVKCHYHGTLIDGTVFDSSVQRGTPAVFPVNGVIAGWVEALQLMAIGSKWRLVIPSTLAYGAHGAGQHIGPHTTLVFEVELLEIV
ncbi:MAG: FKBP-type peptidyl-prolyl cis-trans isomerase [Breznakibacter sp.]|nr:FKBP-type peptidyl-prolyl cis-trans isomerase [Breznakibacter sp.]